MSQPIRALSTVAVVALLALVAGCGGGPVDASPPAASPTTTPPATTLADVPTVTEPVGVRSGLLRDLKAAPQQAPRSLRIDSLGLTAPVVKAGVDRQDRFEVPSADDVGWYRFGPVPGAPGSAVLAAHVAYNGARGAFADLAIIKPGATVDVEQADGSISTFRVTDVVSVSKADLASLGAFDRSGPPVLRLVTCGGEFDSTRRSYSDNVVVTAEPVA